MLGSAGHHATKPFGIHRGSSVQRAARICALIAVLHMLMPVGREDPGAVSVNWKGASIPKYPNVHRRYYIEFDRAKRQAYVRPLSRDGLPWFEMDVSGGRGNVLFAGKRLQGTADWTIQ